MTTPLDLGALSMPKAWRDADREGRRLMARLLTKRPTPKQAIVLRELAKGRTFHQACNTAEVSQSDENRNSMLARLYANEFIDLTVNPQLVPYLFEERTDGP